MPRTPGDGVIALQMGLDDGFVYMWSCLKGGGQFIPPRKIFIHELPYSYDYQIMARGDTGDYWLRWTHGKLKL